MEVENYVNEFLHDESNFIDGTYGSIRKKFICSDGWTISIQASQGHYCEPRVDYDAFYSSVECGYPNRPEYELKRFAEDPLELCNTVYPYVPVDVLNKIIEKHGGPLSQSIHLI